MNIKPVVSFCSLALLLAACGGGSSAPSAAPPPVAVAPAPVPVAPAPVTNVPTLPVTLSGAISGLHSDGLLLRLAPETIDIPSTATSFTFSGKLAKGSPYSVYVLRQPTGATTCSVQNAAGEVGTVDISNINVVCRSITGKAADFAKVYSPVGITFDPSGNLYVTSGHAIRKITTAGVVTMIGETGGYGAYKDGGPVEARFSTPMGLASDKQGNVYVADLGNNAIRKIDAAGNVSTLAGSTKAGADNGKGAAASFKGPRSVAVDSAGTVYVADTGNYMIRKITPDGTVSDFAGRLGVAGSYDGLGMMAFFGAVEGIATDSQDNVWVADTSQGLIRKITPAGTVKTIAGAATSDSLLDIDAMGSTARLHFPMALTVDSAGYVFVTGNGVIRQVGPDGLVSTLAVTGTPGYSDGVFTKALSYSRGIVLGKDGSLYITEPNLDLVRKITPD